MRSTTLSKTKRRIFCVCGGFGFPFGTASTKRIVLLGRALLKENISFSVWHIGPSPFKENAFKQGKYRGINFKYLSITHKWHHKLFRIACYIYGCLQLPFFLKKIRKNSIIYCYYQGNFINFWILFLCKMLKIPAIQEACEWWPETDRGTFFTKWMYNKIMFRWSNAAFPISQLIENRIRSIAGKDYPLCRIPVLVDPEEAMLYKTTYVENGKSHGVLLWCGIADKYKKDIFFLIKSISQLKSTEGKKAILRIVGPCNSKTRKEILSYVIKQGVSPRRIDIIGFVSEKQLWHYTQSAFALLMPLWNNDRSKTRFPTKLGQYVASKRPIVTAKVGEIEQFLTDKTALFYFPGDEESLSLTLDNLFKNPSLGTHLAEKAVIEVLPKIDYSKNAQRIASFCINLS